MRGEVYQPAGVGGHAGGEDGGAAVRGHSAICRNESKLSKRKKRKQMNEKHAGLLRRWAIFRLPK